MNIIKIENLSKRYTLGRTHSTSIRDVVNGIFGIGTDRKDIKQNQEFWALRDINLEIKRGEVVGIIGNNGAGKSTLLKILSRVTTQTTGRVEMYGRVASLLEVGTGFHPELTGRENIYLNGTILGMSNREVKKRFDEIVDFSGVEKFIDTPIKRYSSGMKVRLGFAVAASLSTEILIVDEVLAVGDVEFQHKCIGKMQDVSRGGKTVLFVSHNLGAVAKLCTQGVVVNAGKILCHEPVREALLTYQKVVQNIHDSESDFVLLHANKVKGEEVEVTAVNLTGNDSNSSITTFSDMLITLETNSVSEFICSLDLGIENMDGDEIGWIRSHLMGLSDFVLCGQTRIQLRIKNLPLPAGQYYLNMRLCRMGTSIIYDHPHMVRFRVQENDCYQSGFPPSEKWTKLALLCERVY